MIGIAGSGMAGLAKVLLRWEARVSGTDCRACPVLDELQRRGASVQAFQTAETLPANVQLVVASAAVPDDHPELVAARRRGLPILKYAQLLGLLMARRQGVAVSGTHGKSTTTACLAFTLRRAGFDPSFVIGAEVDQLEGSSGVGDGPHFVAEACEYDRSFLNLRPRFATILNVEADHLDCYPNLDAIRDAFTEFAYGIPPDGRIVINGDDRNCLKIAEHLTCPIETFGLGEANDWRGVDLVIDGGCHRFGLVHCGRALGEIRLRIPGRHNVSNALAVAALARCCGVDDRAICTGISEFSGARRRQEQIASITGADADAPPVTVLDDYGHHPTEVRATLAAVRERYAPRRLWCVFQPHQHSRTRFLLEDFARSFTQADFVLVPHIYFVRDSERERQMVCASDLVERIQRDGSRAEFVPELPVLVDMLVENVQPGDLVITMGAGDIGTVAHALVQRLRANLPN
jgi:UDP-N-acetylmuramate--alanine ligase